MQAIELLKLYMAYEIRNTEGGVNPFGYISDPNCLADNPGQSVVACPRDKCGMKAGIMLRFACDNYKTFEEQQPAPPKWEPGMKIAAAPSTTLGEAPPDLPEPLPTPIVETLSPTETASSTQ